MRHEELLRLIRQPESPTLDFKREWYKIDDTNTNIQNRQRDELIKDILALANGSANTAGEIAHLIIGVDEELDAEGERTLYGVDDMGELATLRRRILQMMEKACDPAVEDIECEIVPLSETRILVITVPPSPHLHETTRELKGSSGGTYCEHVVFTRRGESIGIASARERAAIVQLKQIRFNELRNAPPIRFGAAIGAIIGGFLTIALADKTLGNMPGRAVGFVMGTVVFGLVGASMGYIYRELVPLKNRWPRLPIPSRRIIVLILIAVAVYWLLFLWFQIYR